MDVLSHEVYRAARPLGRRLYNNGGRHALGLGARALEYGVGGSAALSAEHGLKSAFWGIRGALSLGARGYNSLSESVEGRLGHIPRPPMGYHWKGNRPAWMWQHNPRDWRAVPIPPKYVPDKDRPDDFDEDNMYESLETHSLQWYKEAANALSRKVDQEFNGLLDKYQTPRTNADGNYVHYHTGTELTDGAGLAIPLVLAGPHPPEACKDPDLYACLTNNDQAVSNRIHEILRARVHEFVQLEHTHQAELQEMRKAEKANEEMMIEVRKFLLLERYIKFIRAVSRSYEAENDFLRFILGAL